MLKLENIRKEFGTVIALEQINAQIREGEFFTLLGPSGCGKSTLLRTIAGFLEQNAGHVFVAGRLYDSIAPHERNMGMVFQNYAIFPHMSVFDNIAYGLRARKMSAEKIREKVEWGLELVHLQGYEQRKPDQLSGGQKQRVVLARALVIEPQVLLMDEPLSNLDAKLRVQMRADIRKVQQELGITTIYVTHDQEEALAISDRIAVMKDGTIQQLGDPASIYEDPQNTFVAEFIGSMNMVKGVVRKADPGEETIIDTSGHTVTVAFSPQMSQQVKVGEEVIIAVRPEDAELKIPGEAQEKPQGIQGIVGLVSYLGATSAVEVDVPHLDVPLIVRVPNPPNVALKADMPIEVHFPPEKIKLFDGVTGRRL